LVTTLRTSFAPLEERGGDRGNGKSGDNKRGKNLSSRAVPTPVNQGKQNSKAPCRKGKKGKTELAQLIGHLPDIQKVGVGQSNSGRKHPSSKSSGGRRTLVLHPRSTNRQGTHNKT